MSRNTVLRSRLIWPSSVVAVLAVTVGAGGGVLHSMTLSQDQPIPVRGDLTSSGSRSDSGSSSSGARPDGRSAVRSGVGNASISTGSHAGAAASQQLGQGSAYGQPLQTAQARAAIAATVGYLRAADAAYAGAGDTALTAAPATDGAADEVRNSVHDMSMNGIRQRGAVTITQVSAFSTGTPGRVRVVGCLDTSKVQLVSSNGAAVRAAGAPQAPTVHEYVVTHQDTRTGSRWVVTEHTMPADTACTVSTPASAPGGSPSKAPGVGHGRTSGGA